MRPQPQLARQLGGGSAVPGEPQGVRAQGQGDRRAVVGRRRGGRVMIHAVAEGLALSWDQGASTAERLARESQIMDLSTNLALVRTTIARVCLCEYHYGGVRLT